MANKVVAREVAEDELQRLLDLLEIETEDLDEEDLSDFEEKKEPVLKAIMEGRVTLDEQGLPTLKFRTPVDSHTSITFQMPTAATLISLGDSKATNEITKTFATLADLTGTPKTVFPKLNMRDYKIAAALLAFFLS